MTKQPTSPSDEPRGSPWPVDVEKIAALATAAAAIDVESIGISDELVGLPKAVPALLVHGDRPEARSLRNLLEEYRLFPDRKKGTATVQTLESFCTLTNRHKTADSAIFANMDWKNPALTAVIDYHEARSGGRANFGKHRIHYAFPLSEEWKAWLEMDGKAMKQAEFAYFLEDRVAELASPTAEEKNALEAQFATTVATPSRIVELSRGLQVHVETKVKAATMLQTGEGQIAWEESHQDADGKPLKVPGLFILSIAPFFMGDKVRLPVRLRYRAGNPLMWFYQIYRPDQYVTEHVRHALFEAREATALPAFEGLPETA